MLMYPLRTAEEGDQPMQLSRPAKRVPYPHDVVDQYVHVLHAGAVVGDRAAYGVATVDLRPGRHGDALFLQPEKHLLVEGVQLRAVQLGSSVAEIDDVQGCGR